ncbi:MAG: hypothetical protein JNL39_14415 [Opitutaceae bacterium]|nr:hypothetical protein [Opitutaceae bacterium]
MTPATRCLSHAIAASVALAMAVRLAAQSSTDGLSSPIDVRPQAVPLARPILLHFPPSPPPLGQTLPPSSAPSSGRGSAPSELAAHVNEPFYPQLGAQLTTRSLSAKLRGRIDRHRAEKLALHDELRAELDRLRDAEPEARATALAALARKQAPQLAALEKAAEELRRDLIATDQGWSALRDWRLGDRSQRGYSPAEIGQVMRGYAYYENGLLAAQRRLLREIHLELAAAAETTANAAAAQPYLFFSPEPARVLLPDDLPADVAAQLAAYQTQKSKLKKELYDAVFAQESQKLSWIRGSPLKALAEAQRKPLDELEALAEEIRRGLVRHAPPAALAERSPVSPLLQQRIETAVSALGTAQRGASARLNEIFAAHRDVPMATSVRFEPSGLRVIIVPPGPGRGARGASPAPASADPRIAQVRAEAAAVTEDYDRKFADLANELNAIRVEIAQAIGTTRAGAVDQVLNAAVRVAQARENDGHYGDYRIAVFQPGLSPEQRRLLFDRVVEGLGLPLPRGELQPTGRSARW